MITSAIQSFSEDTGRCASLQLNATVYPQFIYFIEYFAHLFFKFIKSHKGDVWNEKEMTYIWHLVSNT